MTSRLETYGAMIHSMGKLENNFATRHIATRCTFFPFVPVILSELISNISNTPVDSGVKVSIMAGKKIFSRNPQETWEGKWKPLETLIKVGKLILALISTLVLGWSLPQVNIKFLEKLHLLSFNIPTSKPLTTSGAPQQSATPASAPGSIVITVNPQPVPFVVSAVASVPNLTAVAPASSEPAALPPSILSPPSVGPASAVVSSAGTPSNPVPVDPTASSAPVPPAAPAPAAHAGTAPIAGTATGASPSKPRKLATRPPGKVKSGIAAQVAAMERAKDEAAAAAKKERDAAAFLHRPKATPPAGTGTAPSAPVPPPGSPTPPAAVTPPTASNTPPTFSLPPASTPPVGLIGSPAPAGLSTEDPEPAPLPPASTPPPTQSLPPETPPLPPSDPVNASS